VKALFALCQNTLGGVAAVQKAGLVLDGSQIDCVPAVNVLSCITADCGDFKDICYRFAGSESTQSWTAAMVQCTFHSVLIIDGSVVKYFVQ